MMWKHSIKPMAEKNLHLPTLKNLDGKITIGNQDCLFIIFGNISFDI